MTWWRLLWRALRGRGAQGDGDWPGVNLIGYATGGLGLGETLRRFAEALDEAGLPFCVMDVQVNLGERGRDERLARWLVSEPRHPVNLLFVNADQLPDVRRHLGEAVFAGRRSIGYWFWELEGFPAAWHGGFDLVDEVWTATRFVQQALAAHSGKPVRIVPHPVVLPTGITPDRAALGLPADPFLFLFTFDVHSFLSRKNPQGAIAAFRRAFPADDQRAALVLKSINGARAPQALEVLREAAGGDPRILFIDGFLPYERAMSMVAACDAYVSLHRSEGFGQGLAEAMALGKPVVATAYSGNMDFMDDGTAALVPAGRVALGPQDYPYGEGQVWAEPDVEAAAKLMRRLVDEPAWGHSLGQAAAAAVARTQSREACVAGMRQELGGGEHR